MFMVFVSLHPKEARCKNMLDIYPVELMKMRMVLMNLNYCYFADDSVKVARRMSYVEFRGNVALQRWRRTT